MLYSLEVLTQNFFVCILQPLEILNMKTFSNFDDLELLKHLRKDHQSLRTFQQRVRTFKFQIYIKFRFKDFDLTQPIEHLNVFQNSSKKVKIIIFILNSRYLNNGLQTLEAKKCLQKVILKRHPFCKLKKMDRKEANIIQFDTLGNKNQIILIQQKKNRRSIIG